MYRQLIAIKVCYGAMKLHNYFRSSASYRVRIAMQLKGLPFEYIAIHLAKGEHLSQSFQDFNAEGLLPVLEVDGLQLTQSMAIIEYLDETRPQFPLLPAEAQGRARVRALSQIIACEIHPVNNLRILKYLTKDLKIAEENKNTWYRHWVALGLQAFEKQLTQGPSGKFCYGDTPTMVDCCLVPQIYNAMRFKVDLSEFKRTMLAYEACMKLPEFQKAHPSACPDFEA